MKIKEYAEETVRMMERFENDKTLEPIDYYKLFDAIEFRLMDLDMWHFYGLTEDDETPIPSNKLIMPSFELDDN